MGFSNMFYCLKELNYFRRSRVLAGTVVIALGNMNHDDGKRKKKVRSLEEEILELQDEEGPDCDEGGDIEEGGEEDEEREGLMGQVLAVRVRGRGHLP